MDNNKINVLIIESEPESLKHITEFLQTNPMISNIESAVDSNDALLKIINRTPNIVFLEYPLKGSGGNELIRFIQTKLKDTTIIFVSEIKEYAVDAIHLGVFNFLLKPVLLKDLEKVMSKIRLFNQINIEQQISQIIENIPDESKIKLQTTSGFLIVAPEDIMFCKADGFYSELHLINNRFELCYLFLSELYELLIKFNFIRISRSYLINQKYIRKIYRASNTIILSSEGKEYEVKGSKIQIRNLCKFETE